MKATRFEFRYRVAIIVLLYAAGFVTPWLLPGWGRGESWGLLIAALNRTGLLSFNASFVVVNVMMLACAFSGALLRWWATAYLSPAMMGSDTMQAGKIVRDGPYRFHQNPLYLGAWLLAVPVAMLMRPAGGALLMIALGVFLLRLIGAEQAFLTRELGAAYERYRSRETGKGETGSGESRAGETGEGEDRVAAAAAGAAAFRPEWLRAAVAESYGLLLALSFATFCWSFNAQLLQRCAIISFGVSLLLSAALTPGLPQAAK